MDEITRILIVEDAAADAELAEREINSNLKILRFPGGGDGKGISGRAGGVCPRYHRF